MPVVRTVRGPVPADDLKIVLPHEHLIMGLNADQILDDTEEVAMELKAFAAGGGGAVVEMTNIGMGRDVGALVEISERSGVHVIAGTGLYFQKYYPAWVHGATIDEITDRFVQEAQVGIDGTGVRPGILGEIGTSGVMTANEIKVLRAAARAQLATGLALSTHTDMGFGGLEQLEVLLAEGVRPDRIIIGHQDLHDLDEVRVAILKRGAYLQLDTFGKGRYRSDEARCADVVKLVGMGYGNRLLLSLDISRKAYLRCHGGCGYVHLTERIVPRLRELGVSQVDIDQMVRRNPAEVLSLPN